MSPSVDLRYRFHHWAWLVILCTGLEGVRASDERCVTAPDHGKSCLTVDHKPFGKIAITKTYDPSGKLLKIECEGLDSGYRLMDGVQVQYIMDGGWQLLAEGRILKLNSPTSSQPQTLDFNQTHWSVTLTQVQAPESLPHVATEDVHRISLILQRRDP